MTPASAPAAFEGEGVDTSTGTATATPEGKRRRDHARSDESYGENAADQADGKADANQMKRDYGKYEREVFHVDDDGQSVPPDQSSHARLDVSGIALKLTTRRASASH